MLILMHSWNQRYQNETSELLDELTGRLRELELMQPNRRNRKAKKSRASQLGWPAPRSSRQKKMMKNLRRRPRATTAETAQTPLPRNLFTLSPSPVVTLSLSAGEARLGLLGPRSRLRRRRLRRPLPLRTRVRVPSCKRMREI